MNLAVAISEPIITMDKLDFPVEAARLGLPLSANGHLSVNIPEKLIAQDNLGTYKPWFNGMKHFYTIKPLPPKPKK